MKNALQYFLELILVGILVLAGAVPLMGITELDIHSPVSILMTLFGITCLFAVIGIVYRWVKIFQRRNK